MKVIIIYFILMSCIGFILYGIDKVKAKIKTNRIKEKSLLLITIIGGSLGTTLGMHIFNHKIRKTKFKVINYLSLTIWCITIFILTFKYIF